MSGPSGLLAPVLVGAACRLLLAPGPRRPLRRLAALARVEPGFTQGRGLHRPPGTPRPSRHGRRPAFSLPGPVLLDLVGAVLHAGAPVTTALRVVGTAADAQGDVAAAAGLFRLAERQDLALDRADPAAPAWVAALEEALLLARETGVAVAPLLAAAAEQERRRQAADARIAAARLGVRVVLPTGLCLLPAFVLLAIVPLVLALLGVG